MSELDTLPPPRSAASSPPPPPPRLRELVVVFCMLTVAASAIVGGLAGWPPAELTRVWVGCAVVALTAAGIRPGGGAHGIVPLLAAGAGALAASELAAEVLR